MHEQLVLVGYLLGLHCVVVGPRQWRRQDFVTGGSKVWVYRGSRVRSPPVPVVLSVYQRGSLLDGLAMHLSCDMKKFHDNESAHVSHNFWTSTHRGEASALPPPLAAPLGGGKRFCQLGLYQ